MWKMAVKTEREIRQCLLYGMLWGISDCICSLLNTRSVYFVIIKNCFVVAASYPFLLA